MQAVTTAQPAPGKLWTACPDGMAWDVCLTMDQARAIRAQYRTAVAEQQKKIVDERRAREDAEIERDALAAEKRKSGFVLGLGGFGAFVVGAGVGVGLEAALRR